MCIAAVFLKPNVSAKCLETALRVTKQCNIHIFVHLAVFLRWDKTPSNRAFCPSAFFVVDQMPVIMHFCPVCSFLTWDRKSEILRFVHVRFSCSTRCAIMHNSVHRQFWQSSLFFFPSGIVPDVEHTLKL